MRAQLLLSVLLAPLLVACETSSRLSPFDNPFGGSDRFGDGGRAPQAAPVEPGAVQAAPLPQVSRQDLAPPPGVATAPAQPVDGLQGGVDPITPGGSASGVTPQQSAKLDPPRAAQQDDGPAPRPTQSSVTGNWTARDASGGSCRVTLSSVTKLDLYGASSSGCASKDLQRITAWELRGDDVYLYEPGGAVAARLKASGRSMSGAIAKSGAPLTLSK
ncbi:MAG: AprI/Inh family metalloprotease inhibitor [Proteobacteria bacterium]|nr:AprI/Inh family metalloprotease inhibitor [Pseudomonadota bacterium]